MNETGHETSGEPPVFPFSALVGQERMKTALLIAATDPGIGGVLIRGHKGTAKSTAVRALAGVLPMLETVENCPFNCPPDRPELMHDACRDRFLRGETLPGTLKRVPIVDLPLNATEDRVAGSMDLERALAGGERVFEPGLLALANRGILYIDEVNLLEDHLTDMLLDVAASGVNTLEREGISYRHPSRFTPVGTMNPEEGELRPQFLDRFALCVNVTGIETPAERLEIVRRRLAFERNPAAFVREWKEAEDVIARRIVAARELLPSVAVPETLQELTVNITVSAGIQGHRADIAIIRAAAALSALLDRTTADREMLSEAARLVIVHRIPSDQHGSHEETEREAERIIRNAGTHGTVRPQEFGPADGYGESDSDGGDIEPVQVPGAAAAGSPLFTFLKKKLATTHPNPERKP